MKDFLKTSEGIDAIVGHTASEGWVDIADLHPDYVIYQTPYDHQYPEHLRSSVVRNFSRIAYAPYYGILIYAGTVEETTHPPDFINNADLIFASHKGERREFAQRLRAGSGTKVEVVGSPMLDAIGQAPPPTGANWPRQLESAVRRILWTPRWRTIEANCHFFDYKDYFLELAGSDQSIDIVLRPHPLMFENFVTTGELTDAEQAEFRRAAALLPNFALDESGDYVDTILASDVLVSDMSSIMVEYFATGKPIIYTHRTNSFNEFGHELSEGFYWVSSRLELETMLMMLLALAIHGG